MEFKHLVFTMTAVLVLIAGALAMTQGHSLESFLQQDSDSDSGGLGSVTGQVVTDHQGMPVQTTGMDAITGQVVNDGVADQSVGFPEVGRFVVYLFVLFFLVAGVFVLTTVSSRLDEKQDSRRAMVQYIKVAKKQGFDKDKIRQRLEEHGWQENDLNRGFDKVH